MSFNSKLIDLLKTNRNFVDDEGELLLAAVQDRAWKIDHDLVKLLLSDKEIKAKFFDEIEKHWIFNINTFLEYISQKNFLNNSYTRFRNRIGLTIGEKYLRERGDVALVWAYKDTVLEGGQTKEDERRKEIFFNEVLAQDEINRLLDPKVLTNFTRYTAKGKQPVNEFKRDENGIIRENLILKGNNLLVLHTLKNQYRGQVKLIYIDPPYNTGNDSFGYNDNFNHSTWLTFMKNRLEVAVTLLRDDGVIFVQCDDNEQAYLKILMDEIFGTENFLNCVAVKMSAPAGLKMSHKTKKLLKIKEYLLVYTKINSSFELSNIDDLYVDKVKYETERSDKYVVNHTDEHQHWQLISLHQAYIKYANKGQEKVDFVNENFRRIFNHVINSSTKQAWDKLSKKEKLQYKDKVRMYNVAGSDYQYALNDHVLIPYNPKNLEGDLWAQNYSIGGTKTDEGGVEFKNGKKREVLLKRIISISTNLSDIVLDFHIGSGTTCAVAHKMGRQYIGVEQLDYGENDSVIRLQNVISGEQSGISKLINWQGGGEFIYFELMKYNEAFMERIQAAKNSKELIKVWEDMAEGSFLNWYVNPEMPEEAIKYFEELGKEKNGLENQKRELAKLLDKNQLYVNLSEIDDAQFKVSKEDKALNKAFYGEK